MKQELKSEEGNVLVYGDDHIEGLFYKVTSYDGVVLEESSQLDNPLLTIELIAEFVLQYGFDLTDELPEKFINDL